MGLDAEQEALLRALLAVDTTAPDEALRRQLDELPPGDIGRTSSDFVGVLPDRDTYEIVKLVKVLVRVENLSAHRLNSTSQVYRYLEELDHRDAALGEELRAWAFHTAGNPYVPFGTQNPHRYRARSLKEYYALRAARAAKVEREERERGERAKLARRERAAGHRQRMRAQRGQSQRRRALLRQLQELKQTGCLEVVAADTQHPPYFYPDAWAVTDRAQIAALNPQLRERLRERLKYPPRGPWRIMARLLRRR